MASSNKLSFFKRNRLTKSTRKAEQTDEKPKDSGGVFSRVRNLGSKTAKNQNAQSAAATEDEGPQNFNRRNSRIFRSFRRPKKTQVSKPSDEQAQLATKAWNRSDPACTSHSVDQAFSSLLAGLAVDTLVLEGSGAECYFLDEGKEVKQLIENNLNILALMHRGPQDLTLSNRSFGTNSAAAGTTDALKQRNLENIQYLLSQSKENRAVFRSLTSFPTDTDASAILPNEAKLHVVKGDISQEKVDAVVNTTNFKNFETPVCKSILDVAGPNVKSLLPKANVKEGTVFTTPPGSFPCRVLLHVDGKQNAGIIEQLMSGIIEQSELFRCKSVAIPAICTGTARMDPAVSAHAIVEGIKKASFKPFNFVSNIRLVMNDEETFSVFEKELTQMFSKNTTDRGSSISSSLQMLSSNSLREKSTFTIVGLCEENVDEAMISLENLYERHCSSKTFSKKDVENLTQDNVRRLKELVESECLHVQYGGLHEGTLKVSGLKDGVTKVVQELVHLTPLQNELRAMEEDNLYSQVTWCLLGPDGEWEGFPKEINLELEEGNVAQGFIDDQGLVWKVDLERKEAETLGQKIKLKRLEHRTDFTLPLYWDNMSTEEKLKVVRLETTSSEYRTVERGFLTTARCTVIKIERLQNVHLRRVYEVHKDHMDIKNKDSRGAGEMLLYHGTSHDVCEAIMQNGFNRSFSGKNGTSFGNGVYFAVNATYSVNYAKPAAGGSRTMFVARVLTGAFTQGKSSMKVPPPRDSKRPHDRFDSVVDRTDNPNVFVVFNDNQAYPDYLITFR